MKIEIRDFLTFWTSKIILRVSNKEQKTIFRKLEKFCIKLTNVEQHILFNEQCLQHNIFPVYTNIKLHDATTGAQKFVSGFRRNLIVTQIEQQKQEILKTQAQIDNEKLKLGNLVQCRLKFDAYMCFLSRLCERRTMEVRIKHERKLCQLYGEKLPTKEVISKVVNLTNIVIDNEINEILELGLNCHLKTKPSPLVKKIEIEKLYETIKRKSDDKKLKIVNDEMLRCELKRFGLRPSVDFNRDLLSKKQYGVLKEFCSRDDIIIRKADKTSTIVVMCRNDYVNKLDEMLSDTNKFRKLKKDSTENIKKDINGIIDTVNAKCSGNIFSKLEGHYSPGYMYGNPKIHKNIEDPPLRPIISQIGTPVYDIAKKINELIVQYMPKKYVVNSTHEFVALCKSVTQPSHIASLDVESLFTNVPVQETIDIILEHVYNHPTLKRPSIPQQSLRSLLLICTTQCPFRSAQGQLYVQTDGVSMGSPLGPTFANYYMCQIENNVIPSLPRPLFCNG